MIEAYFGIAIVVAMLALLVCNIDQDFDKFVHDHSNGQIEFNSFDRIVIPLFVGLVWPLLVYKAIRKAIHG